MSDPEDTSPPNSPAEPAKSEGSENAKADVVLLHSPTEDGKGVRVLRAREGRVEAGELRPIESGRPLQGDLVKLRPRKDAPLVCDVEVTYEHKAGQKSHPGPAHVATPAYRDSWDRIFGAGTAGDTKTRKDDLN